FGLRVTLAEPLPRLDHILHSHFFAAHIDRTVIPPPATSPPVKLEPHLCHRLGANATKRRQESSRFQVSTRAFYSPCPRNNVVKSRGIFRQAICKDCGSAAFAVR